MRARLIGVLSWTAALLWAGVIFNFSALPGSNVPGRFGSVAHFVEYAVFAFLLFAALRPRHAPAAAAVLAVAIASSYGITDELHQAFVPMRMPDTLDWLVDTAGAVTGATLAAATMTRAARRSSI